MSDFANIAAATAAGWKQVTQRPGDGSYVVHLERWMTGAPGASGFFLRAHGHASSQAAAEAQALSSLNEQRRLRYAGTSSIPVDSHSFESNIGVSGARGTALTSDVS
jgi:hypothetical protein